MALAHYIGGPKDGDRVADMDLTRTAVHAGYRMAIYTGEPEPQWPSGDVVFFVHQSIPREQHETRIAEYLRAAYPG